jgi:hypothetical protein
MKRCADRDPACPFFFGHFDAGERDEILHGDNCPERPVNRPIEKVRVKLEPTRFAHPVIDGRQCTLEKTCLSVEERRPRHRSME